MQASCILILLVLAIAGCTREPFAPDPAWKTQMEARYDLHALETFIKDTTAKRGTFDGIDLCTAKLGNDWENVGHSLVSGFWIFTEDEHNNSRFTLSYNFSPKPIVELQCLRIDRTTFSLERLAILIDYQDEPSTNNFPSAFSK